LLGTEFLAGVALLAGTGSFGFGENVVQIAAKNHAVPLKNTGVIEQLKIGRDVDSVGTGEAVSAFATRDRG
jgi:hypothetical protein